jgi:hypothetical protein
MVETKARKVIHAATIRAGKTNDQVAEECGMTHSTYYNRLNDEKFTLPQLRKIVAATDMTCTEVVELFLVKKNG